MRKFPQDCPVSCPHYRRYDMSVDDYTNICYKLGRQIDDCDQDFEWEYCPLDEKEEKE